MSTTITKAKKTLDDFAELIIKIPEELRDNAYYTINGMILNYECEKANEQHKGA